ncbi:MAG TPA: peptidylprolyl isomerase [Burkholderiaceae bacterium]|nr:peptidylprolyl isomerase [Burkholderiaceae bacterium]
MKIDQGALVSLDVTMYDAQGNLLEHSDEPLVYLHGHDDVFPRVEEALAGKEAGARVALQLEPEEAFGDYDPALVLLMPLENLGEGVEVGMRVEGDGGQGTPGRIFTITDIADGMAVLDGNHPLAGFALRFDIAVIDVRGASAEELADAEAPRLPEFLRLAEPRQTTLH